MNDQNFKYEIVNFVRDRTGLSNEKILDKRFEHNTLNKLVMETLAKYAFSEDHASSLIEITAYYK